MTDALGELLARARARGRARLGAAFTVAGVGHASLGAAVGAMHSGQPRDIAPVQEVSAVFEEPPPPAPDDDVQQAKTEEPAPAGPKSNVAAPRTAAAPAQAGAVLTASDDAPADLTGGMVVGSAETYGGGATSPVATATRRGTAGPATPPPASPPPAPQRQDTPDQSRSPRLAGGASWSCPFPAEADGRGIDDAVVRLRVEVGADGRIAGVVVVGDPGAGFGREAAACARGKRFAAARDRDGRPVAGHALVNVRFHR